MNGSFWVEMRLYRRGAGFSPSGTMWAGIAVAAVLLFVPQRLPAADLVLLNGKVVTLDPARPQAQAIAIRGDRIVVVGTEAEVRQQIGGTTRVVDLAGRLTIPGFIEGHGHFLSLGRARMNLDLSKAAHWEEIVALVENTAKTRPPGEWIIGRGWHQEKWERPPSPNVEGYPLHDALSRISPRNPVLLTHGTGHMSFANARAMELAGVDGHAPDPPGGTILRTSDGEPTGIFRETAQGLISRAYRTALAARSPEERKADELKAVELATQECLSKGVTSFQDAGSSFADVDLYRRLAENGQLGIRLWVMLRDDNASLRKHLAEYRTVGLGDNHLTVRAIKRMVDGALGSHGAWLLEPYRDLPSSRGLVVEPLETIRETAMLALEHDFQLCVHAIGDRANREILDLYRTVFRTYPDKRDLRWRIEHAQHLHPDDIPRFGELGVIASMQANHATSDGPFVVDRLGTERARVGAYAWRSLLDSGATVINGTDAPVEDVDPIGSYYASVARRLKDGTLFFDGQCMSRMEALRSYTRDAAWAAFEDDLKGTLTPGKLADIVVLSHDILTVPEMRLPETRVDLTIVGGRVMYER